MNQLDVKEWSRLQIGTLIYSTVFNEMWCEEICRWTLNSCSYSSNLNVLFWSLSQLQITNLTQHRMNQWMNEWMNEWMNKWTNAFNTSIHQSSDIALLSLTKVTLLFLFVSYSSSPLSSLSLWSSFVRLQSRQHLHHHLHHYHHTTVTVW